MTLNLCQKLRNSSFLEGTTVDYYDLDKLITEIREYEAIESIKLNGLCPFILNSKTIEEFAPLELKNDEIARINKLLGFLKKKFNPSQYDAIKKINRLDDRMQFIQGPPGTGKTSTIMGILACEFEKLKKYK